MLSLPDLKEKKIIFIPAFGKLENVLKFRNNNLCLYREGKLINKVSCHIIISVYIIGEFTLTSQLIKKLKSYGISIFMLNQSFQCYAQIMSEAEGNFKLREIQYTASEKFELDLAKIIIANKVGNQYSLLKSKKLRPDKGTFQSTLSAIESVTDFKSLLGIEGNYSSIYFRSLFKEVGWFRRAPRTKEDIPNLMLDIGYTYLFNFVDSLLLLFGFDTYKGVYHKLFFQRKSLSCDLLEPLRPLVDRELIKAYNLKKINEKEFSFKNGSFYFKTSELQKKYTWIWFNLIIDHKEEIYEYVLSYYRYVQDQKKYSKPQFLIK